MSEKLLTRSAAAFVFLFSFVVYFLTMAPTVSFWDCGEFIACSYKLAVPHPPGAPLYLLVGRIFTLLPIFEDIGRRVNFISTISSALTVMLLYLIIVHMIKNFLKEREGIFQYIPHLGGIIGALTFAFTTSFWFNAVEAEVYAASMLFTSLVVWLILHWSERSEEIGNEKYILVIAYLMGLATGVHLLNVLAIPTVMMIIFYKRYEVNLTNFIYLGLVGVLVTAMVYPGIVKGVPEIAEFGGFFLLLVVITGIFFLMVWAIRSHHPVFSILFMSILLIVIGYSSYLMIYIRSNLDPNIDENDPETIEQFISYLNREQYGEHSVLDRYGVWQQSPNKNKYNSTWEFFWKYQVNYMYIRYFLWNFLGKHINEVDVDWLKFLGIPFLLGLLGAYYHFRRDWKYALAVFVLFFMTGLAIIIYLNQPDPQPRERDYSYVGSFFAYSIWVGIGAAAILEYLARQAGQAKGISVWLMALLLFVLSPLQMLAKNYHTQSRAGNYVAWDYSYNMLQTCEPNGIIYTNGDNDTFPLWYLQEVENIRTDVRVVNLSLLNTNWYIKQLKYKEPRVPIELDDREIENIMPMRWPKTRTIEVAVPRNVREKELEEYRSLFPVGNLNFPDKISFELGPKVFKQFLRVQDIMILNTLFANKFQKPMYFAVTCSKENMLDGLQRYLRMDGLAFKIVTIPNWNVHPEKMYENYLHRYQYRNLNNPDVYYNGNIIALLQNYRWGFIQLADYYLGSGDTTRFSEVIHKAYEVMPDSVIPQTNPILKQYMDTFYLIAGIKSTDVINTQNYTTNQLQEMGRLAMRYNEWDLAKVIFETAAAAEPDNIRVKGYLVDVYGELKQYDKAIGILEDWLKKNPQDKAAQQRLDEYRQRQKEQAQAPERTGR